MARNRHERKIEGAIKAIIALQCEEASELGVEGEALVMFESVRDKNSISPRYLVPSVLPQV